MRLPVFLFLLTAFCIPVFCQTSEVKVEYDKRIFTVTSIDFHNNRYFSFNKFVDILSVPHNYGDNRLTLEAEFEEMLLSVTADQPFLILKSKKYNYSKVIQLPVSTLFVDGQIFVPLQYCVDALSIASGKKVWARGLNELIVNDIDPSEKNITKDKTLGNPLNEKSEIKSVIVYEKGGGIILKFSPDTKISSYRSYYHDKSFSVILKNSRISSDSLINTKTDLVNNVRVKNINSDVEITLDLNTKYYFSDVTEISGTNDLLFRINVQPDPTDWFRTESEHFVVIYRESHSALIPYIVRSAENALSLLTKLFNYEPSEKIVINTYDVSDYGFGATTTVPQNYIRIEIEPLEPGYENIPYNERLQWLLNHELVHVVVNDQASNIEAATRNLFLKVAPEQVQPITVFYSLLTNFSRYTPRWHQEAIAVFLETWMSGGFGRILGNFDEMYFRTMVLDNQEFPSDIKLDAKSTQNSFLIETLFYLYGARFSAYLAIKYGAEKLLDWFKTSPANFYNSFVNKFEKIFKTNFDKAWKDFIDYEKSFQKGNIEKLNSSQLTNIKRLKKKPVGWVTQPYFDPVSESVIFGYHQPHNLSSIQKFDLHTLTSTVIGTLPTPNQFQVASTAFDYKTGLFFFTENNNQLYRDVYVLDVESGETKDLFIDGRIGHLTVSPQTHELWGIQHSGGKASVIYSPYPYNTIEQVSEFVIGDEIEQLAVSPSGRYIAATLLRSNGEQSIILINSDSLRAGDSFNFEYLASSGSPENPSWSMDGKFLFWNAYTNGVSNIYKMSFENGNFENHQPIAISNTLRGLFKPIQINPDLLFAFEFTSEGLIPVTLRDEQADKLPAIKYLGQEVIKKNSEVYNWYVKPHSETSSFMTKNDEEEYNGLENLKILTIVPTISGFQKQKVLGIFTHISDPLINHDLTIEMGYSPFNENPLGPKFHFRGKYEYKKQYSIGIEHNASDFYDLFNKRKRGLVGTKIHLGSTHYWVYDNPLKIKQQSEIAYYTDLIFINDNVVRVSEPDFAVAQTTFNSRNLRRTIGSSDYEYGNEFEATLRLFGYVPDNFEYAAQLYAGWDHFTTFFWRHNVFHLKLVGGYHYKNDRMFQARFFFGGFGNRALENVDVKQYRKIFRFPGIPIYSLDAEKFIKIMFEDNLPPLRFSNASIGQHYLSHVDFAVYSQGLYVKSSLGEKWIDIGAQINFIFKHWFNLESTLSAGIANAWFNDGSSWEWFVSFKLLKN